MKRPKTTQRRLRPSVPVPHVAASLKDEDLTPAQLSALLTALDAEEDQGAADVVRLALYTGARR